MRYRPAENHRDGASVSRFVCNPHRKETMMIPHKIRIALSAAIVVLAAVSVVDSSAASAELEVVDDGAILTP
jgi:hypothetical protein